MSKCLVIYYNGNDHKAALLEPRDGGPVDGFIPYNWQLPDDHEIIAVIAQTDTNGFPINFNDSIHNVYVNEQLILFDETGADVNDGLPGLDQLENSTDDAAPSKAELAGDDS